ncbi:hypothetical protein NKR19_g5519 [Coniochaeta hoffmannii]|uniref:Uncharacterized protein n=1 Tax=Coniochaeta hoffmannii TaxID=91930 RepID=A0AA38VG89_9PEZI|nr:hypothetical protein NKR19_g5519 [Coniochaeta hoffmannii]
MARRFWAPSLFQAPGNATGITTSNNHPSREDIAEPLQETPFRAEFSMGPGVVVFGFPQKGGLYELARCFSPELDFLGLDRFRPTPRPSITDAESRAEEEAHCNKMRQLGARYYNTTSAWESALWGNDFETGDADFLKIGWPSTGGGVWVLRCTVMEASERGVAAIYNAFNMDERCKIIKQLGGTFYADPKDCPYLDLDD